MFKCQACKKIIGPGVSPILKIIETRIVIYPKRFKRIKDEIVCIDNGGTGTEIAKQLVTCGCLN